MRQVVGMKTRCWRETWVLVGNLAVGGKLGCWQGNLGGSSRIWRVVFLQGGAFTLVNIVIRCHLLFLSAILNGKYSRVVSSVLVKEQDH